MECHESCSWIKAVGEQYDDYEDPKKLALGYIIMPNRLCAIDDSV
jgi:hypothetical protein